MIKVLKTWDEIGESIICLQDLQLSVHHQPQKNWDLCNMLTVIEKNVEKSAAILDIGARGCPVLEILLKRGYTNLYGIDLNFDFWEKFNRTIMAALHRRDFRSIFGSSPIKLKNANLCKTDFPKNKFMAITSLSVVEHGISWDDYFKEMSRILKPGGYLLTSTDFWHEEINTNEIFICGAPMRIFTPKDITQALSIAYKYGFKEMSESIENTKQQCVTCNGIQYTFLLFVLQKV